MTDSLAIIPVSFHDCICIFYIERCSTDPVPGKLTSEFCSTAIDERK